MTDSGKTMPGWSRPLPYVVARLSFGCCVCGTLLHHAFPVFMDYLTFPLELFLSPVFINNEKSNTTNLSEYFHLTNNPEVHIKGHCHLAKMQESS